MGELTDFNDLHCTEGLETVRKQVMAVINAQSPSISVGQIPRPPNNEGSKFSLDNLLQKFALIHGETKVWDMANRKAIKKTAFMDLVGRTIAKEWLEHKDRRTITLKDTKALVSSGGSGEQERIIDRYFYLYPTKEAWDNVRKDTIPIDALKLAIPSDYDWWLKNPRRKEFDIKNLVFDPKQKSNPDTHINMFTGLPLVPAKTINGCENILKLLWNLCNDKPKVFDWFCKWLAYPIQHVGAKLDSAVLMHSDIQGTGKSMLFSDLMPQIYGRYGAVLGQHQLESNYTEWKSNMLFGSFEEIFSRSQKYSHMGTVKHMITGKTQRIEKKYVSGWEEANHMNAAFLSNEMQPFPIEKTDRRMLVIWPKETMSRELQYAAGEEIDSGEGAKAFYRYLLNYPLEDFNPHTKPFETLAKKRLIEYSLPPWDVFFDDWKSGDLAVPYCSCLSNDLYIAYSKFCRRRNEHLVSQTKFSTILSTKIEKRRMRYSSGQTSKQAVIFIIRKEDEFREESKWISEAVEKFYNHLENMEGQHV